MGEGRENWELWELWEEWERWGVELGEGWGEEMTEIFCNFAVGFMEMVSIG